MKSCIGTEPNDLNRNAVGFGLHEKYAVEMGEIYEYLLPLLKPKGHCAVNVQDMWWENKRITIHVSLFHMEPSPRELKHVPSILLPKYGWLHDKAGIKYPANEMSFRQTINLA